MIKFFKCTILESNSGPLDLQSDALPVELSRRSRYVVHYNDNLTTARMNNSKCQLCVLNMFRENVSTNRQTNKQTHKQK